MKVWILDGNYGCVGVYSTEKIANTAMKHMYKNGYFGELEVLGWEVTEEWKGK
jgi:hypothetical protein